MHKTYLHPYLQITEIFVYYAVRMKIDFESVRSSEKAVTLVRKQGAYDGMRQFLVAFHIATLLSDEIFQFTPRVAESVSYCNVEIFVEFALDHQFSAGYGHINVYGI